MTRSIIQASEFGVGPTSSAADNTIGLQTSYDAASPLGATIILPSGTLQVTSNPKTEIATHEGAAVMMLKGKGVSWQGQNTIIEPKSNKIEIFVQNGASDISFSGIKFDNSQNGLLQNTVKVPNFLPNAGVKGQGNSCNAAIRQYRGKNLSVRNCEFDSFMMAIQYFGDSLDRDISSGDVVVENNLFRNGAFGLIAHNNERVFFKGNKEFNGVNRINKADIDDPGHLFYQAGRSGPIVKFADVSSNYWENSLSSGLSIRNVEHVSCLNNSGINCARGISLSVIKSGIVNGNLLKLKASSTSRNNSALEINNCGDVIIGPANLFDISGTDAWGFRIRKGIENAPDWADNGVQLNAPTIIYDDTSTSKKSPIYVIDQNDFLAEKVIFKNKGTSTNKRPFELIRCKGAKVNAPYLTKGIKDGNRVISLKDCSNAIVFIDQKFTGYSSEDAVRDKGGNVDIQTHFNDFAQV